MDALKKRFRFKEAPKYSYCRTNRCAKCKYIDACPRRKRRMKRVIKYQLKTGKERLAKQLIYAKEQWKKILADPGLMKKHSDATTKSRKKHRERYNKYHREYYRKHNRR